MQQGAFLGRTLTVMKGVGTGEVAWCRLVSGARRSVVSLKVVIRTNRIPVLYSWEPSGSDRAYDAVG